MGADTEAVAAAAATAGTTFMVGCLQESGNWRTGQALSQPDQLNLSRPSSSSGGAVGLNGG